LRDKEELLTIRHTAEMESFRLRVATAEDIAGIRGLIDASVRGLQAGDYSAAQIEAALRTVFTVDSQLIADGTYFVALDDAGEMAGCGGWSKRKTLYGGDNQVEKIVPELLDPAIDAAKVRAIFVHPRFARMGLGSLILEAAEEAALAAGFKRFEMGSTLTGVALYSLKGYREVARLTVPVGDEDEIEVVRMVKDASE
jgi:GNAT superfamily N-acetyltransferase